MTDIQLNQQVLIQQAKRHGFGPFRGYDHQLATVVRQTKTQIFVKPNGNETAPERRFVKETLVEYGKVDYHTPEVRLIVDDLAIQKALYEQSEREAHQLKIQQAKQAWERLQEVFGPNSIHHRTAAELDSLIQLTDQLAPKGE